MIVMLAGGVAAGKTTTARELANRVGDARVVSVRDYLSRKLALRSDDRVGMQTLGAELEHSTTGKWILDAVNEQTGRVIILDSVRTMEQAAAVRESDAARLVFLRSTARVREQRYLEGSRNDPMKAKTDFARAVSHATERGVMALEAAADFVIDTDASSPGEAAEMIRQRLGMAQ